MEHRPLRRALISLALLTGCPPKEGATDTGAASSGGAASTSGAASTGAPTGGATGATTGAEPPATCDGFCEKLSACGLDGAFDVCPCLGQGDISVECTESWQKVYPCMVAESCEAVADMSSACWTLYLDAVDVCSGGGDECVVSGSPPGPEETCWFEFECPEQTRRIECDAETCTCLTDGVAGKSCLSEDACATMTIADKFFACCAP